MPRGVCNILPGTYFVKHLKGNGNGNLVNKMAASQATRTKVTSAVVCAKAVEDAKEVTPWKDAGDSVFDFEDKEVHITIIIFCIVLCQRDRGVFLWR